jgi:hypothetical protein
VSATEALAAEWRKPSLVTAFDGQHGHSIAASSCTSAYPAPRRCTRTPSRGVVEAWCQLQSPSPASGSRVRSTLVGDLAPVEAPFCTSVSTPTHQAAPRMMRPRFQPSNDARLYLPGAGAGRAIFARAHLSTCSVPSPSPGGPLPGANARKCVRLLGPAPILHAGRAEQNGHHTHAPERLHGSEGSRC